MTSKKGDLTKMKSRKLGLAILALALVAPLSSCGQQEGASEAKIDADLTVVDPTVGEVVLASARKNLLLASHLDSSVDYSADYSQLYTGALSVYNHTSKQTTTTTAEIYSNQVAKETMLSKETSAFYGGANRNSTGNIEGYFWFDDYTPKETTSTENMALYVAYQQLQDGKVIAHGGQTEPLTVDKADTEAPDRLFHQLLSDMILSQFRSFLTVTSTPDDSKKIYKKGSDYVVYDESSMLEALSNPAYPNDANKAIATMTATRSMGTISYDSAKGYYLSRYEEANSHYASRGFEEDKKYDDVLVFASQKETYNFQYDELKAFDGKPEKDVEVESENVPSLLTYSLDGATKVSGAKMKDVTLAYKTLYPAEQATYVFLLSSENLYSSSLYSFGYGATPEARDGYSYVKDNARFGKIEAAEGLPKFFKAEDGKYEIYAFVTMNGDVPSATYSANFLA
jgi:hypothetical protein